MQKLLTVPFAALAILTVCLVSLSFALLMQYGFGILPCELCLWQRGPFVAGAVLAAMTFLVPLRFQKFLMILCVVFFLANSGLAVFHSGVERHWWVFHSACTGSASLSGSIEAMREQLLATPVTRCDEISWSLFGLSMANFNIVFSFVMGVFAFWAAHHLTSRN